MVPLTVLTDKYGVKLDKFLQKKLPTLSFGSVQKIIRKGDVKINGFRTRQNQLLKNNDALEVYVNPEKLEVKEQEIEIVYEDDNILIVNKPAGLLTFRDKIKNEPNLEGLLKEYAIQQTPKFKPRICHRLDRNTQGLLIIAKSDAIMNAIIDHMRNHEIYKYYLCIVIGKPKIESGTLEAYLTKNSRKGLVTISRHEKRGSEKIITKYKIVGSNGRASMLEVQLVTGKTHQIRAHLAHIGYPIVGDRKYGNREDKSEFAKVKQQQLCAYKIMFKFKQDARELEYLNGKTFEVEANFALS